jgi:hypothetical protein
MTFNADHCECTWKFHEGQPCRGIPADTGSVMASPTLCTRCLFVCEGERDDEADAAYQRSKR